MRRVRRHSFDQRFPKKLGRSNEPVSLLVPESIRQTVIDLDHCSQIKIGSSRDATSQSKSGVDGSQRSVKGTTAGEKNIWNVYPYNSI
jgi:hypothetical protein